MNLSVIIPTLNEEDSLPSTIRSVRENAVITEPCEIIIADSGSCDGTQDLALELGLKLVRCVNPLPGRASALNQGAASASGGVFLFLDADTSLPEGYDESIRDALEDPGTVGGAFEFSLDGGEFGLRVVEFINRTRYRVRQRYYGDQGVFVRAGAFKAVGGVPELRLLETAYFCKALKKIGKLELIKKNIKTSPRRFLRGGIYSVLAGDIKIWFLDLAGIPVDRWGEGYWKENTSRKKN
jgi:glycosyltransferase involved in cell wall biosynthesis